MDEIPAFSRRHTPRHSVHVASHVAMDYSRDNDAVLLSARDRLAALAATTASDVNAPRATAKTRKPTAAPTSVLSPKNSSSSSATIVKAVAGHAAASRKMSSTQLRAFFLLCVALYFAVICFADDIVNFAQWVGDDENAAVWKAAIATTPSPTKTMVAVHPANGRPDAVNNDTAKKPKPSDGGGVLAEDATTKEVPKKGNLRSEEATTQVVATALPVEAISTKPTDAQTPAVLVKKEAESTEPTDATTPPPRNDEAKANEGGSPVSVPQRPEMGRPEALRDEQHQPDDLDNKDTNEEGEEGEVEDEYEGTHKPVDDDQDAPLDSAEEREREARVDQAVVVTPSTNVATPMTTALDSPAEVPKTAAQTESVKTEAPVDALHQDPDSIQPVHNDDGAMDPDAAP